MGRLYGKEGSENMRQWNPMSLFDNKVAKFNTPEEVQKEYLHKMEKTNQTKEKLYRLWQDPKKR